MDETSYLRELAKRQRALAESPENKALAQLWYAHNALENTRPLVVFEAETCKHALLTDN